MNATHSKLRLQSHTLRKKYANPTDAADVSDLQVCFLWKTIIYLVKRIYTLLVLRSGERRN